MSKNSIPLANTAIRPPAELNVPCVPGPRYETIPVAPSALPSMPLPAPAWARMLGQPPVIAPAAGHPLGDKTFAGLSAQLIRELPREIEQDATLRQMRSKLADAARELDESLTKHAPTQTLSPELDQLRANWRQAFIVVRRTANDMARAAAGEPDDESAAPGRKHAAPDIDRIYAEGGGAKGQAMMGALMLLQESGELERLRGGFAGTSIGSMLASSAACGADMEKISASGLSEDVSELITREVTDDPALLAYQKADGLDLKFSGIGKAAPALITHMNRVLADAMVDRLQSIGAQPHEAAPERQRLIQGFINIIRSSVVGPTFGMLDELEREFPKYFKQLSIPAFDTHRSEGVYFESRNPAHASLPIAVAVRASAALAPSFKTVNITLDGRRMNLTDGGVKDKVPLGAFQGAGAADGGVEKKDLTDSLIFMFSREGGSDKVLHAPQREAYRNNKAHPVVQLFSGAAFKMSGYRNVEADQLRDHGLNVAVLGHGKIATTDFKASAYDRSVAQMEGEFDMARYLTNRVGQSLD